MANGIPDTEVAEDAGTTVSAIHRWTDRFMSLGVDSVVPPYPPPRTSSLESQRPKTAKRLSAATRFELTLRARLASRDYEGTILLYLETPKDLLEAGEEIMAHEIGELIAERRFAAAEQLLDLGRGVTPDSPLLMSSALASRLARDDWEAAGSLMTAADRILRDSGDHGLWLTMFKVFCMTMQFDQAARFLAEGSADVELMQSAVPHVAAMNAALKEGGKTLDLVASEIDRGQAIEHGLLLEALAAAARQTGEYSRVLDLLTRSLKLCESDRTRNLLHRVMAEISLASAVGVADPVTSEAAQLPIENRMLAQRTSLLTEILEFRNVSNEAAQIYFCTDRNYLVGTCVALSSLFRNNPGITRSYPVTVVCQDAVCDEATQILREIAGAFGSDATVLPASELVGPDLRLKTGWGLFTLGHGLSDAAYYRIFMARAMSEAGTEGRALYLDSDTCIGPGLETLLTFDLDGQPLAARPELPLNAIVNAANKLGLDPETYFNSGVLLFDLQHADLPRLLNRTIEVALREPEKLTFVDQCALNIAFAGATARLPAEFNRYVRQSDPVPSEIREPVVWHFVARPKPWDPVYRTVHSLRWIKELQVLGQFLPPDRLKGLMAVQFTKER
jgi:lipopolysaccharide biosynthesis glycosyltransferase